MASAAVTRMLVLGVVSLFQPVNGYQVLRELSSWAVEDWAEVRPGSIYSMLNSLSKQGMLTRHELTEADRAVAVYELSPTGNDEFPVLVRRALDGSAGLNQVMFQVGMSFAPLLPRDEVVAAMRQRIEAVTRHRDGLRAKIGNMNVPSHVRHAMTLNHSVAEAELSWVAEFTDMVQNGFLWFAGETGDPWQPPDDDAGWEMVEQARQYREELAKRKG